MYRKRFLLFIPLLISVTLCVSMGPNFMNSYIKKDLLESKNYWTYNEPENVEITDAEFAQFIVNNDFEDGTHYSNGYSDADKLELTAIKKQTKDVLHKAFGEDKAAFEKIESIIDSDMVFYDRQVILTVIKSRTMPFVFVNLIYKNEIEQIEIVYEEKTSAICMFIYQTWDPEKIDWYCIDSLFLSAETYSQNVLGLNKDQYMIWLEGEDNVFIASFSIANDKQGDQTKEEVSYEYEGTYYN